MTTTQLNRCKEFLDYFNVDYAEDILYLTDGGNSCIMNPNTQWNDFLGYSINSITQAVADELGKTAVWKD